MSQVIAVVNQKGGVGKTTTVITLGAALAEMGHRVLLVDFDSGQGLSVSLGLEASDQTIEKALFDGEGDRDRFIHSTDVDRLCVVPAGADLAGAELALANEMNRERFLARAIRPWRDRFDYILVDNTPSLGLLVVNAMAAADSLLVPVECLFLSLRALGKLLETFTKVREREIQPRLELAWILPTMFNPSINQCSDVVARLREQFGSKVFKTVIRNRSQYTYATVAKKPVTAFDPKSDAAEMYRTVARELVAVSIPESAPVAASA